MPYIQQGERPDIDSAIDQLNIEHCGQLNYAISMIIKEYLKRHGNNYSNINEVIGVLECAKLEVYRRTAAPYEDIKIKENGDI